MNNEFINAYDAEIVQRKLMNSSKQEGIEQGKYNNQLEIINNMLKNNFTLEQISLATNIEIKKVEEIIKKHNIL